LLTYAIHCTNFSECTKEPSGNALAIMVLNVDISGIPFFEKPKTGTLNNNI
jgi:hypothetical protein